MTSPLPTPSSPVTPSQESRGVLKRLAAQGQAYLSLVRFEHTIFALPFALSAMLLACRAVVPAMMLPDAWTLLMILLAMVGGRTYAMALNRLADAKWDALNPRTQNREIPSGRVKPIEAMALTLLSLGVFVWATAQLPPLCFQLLPIAIGILTLYSFMKRFSSLCHVVLGIALGTSAIGGWMAVTGSWNDALPVWFGLAVTCWVVGFDIIYACLDEGFDRQVGLHSLPVRLGKAHALTLSAWLHGLTVVFLTAFGYFYSQTLGFIGYGYSASVLLIAVMLIWEHRLVRPDDLSRVNEAFFTMNGRISTTIFFCVLFDTVARGA